METKKLFKVKIKFKTPVHFGAKEKTYNTTQTMAHSDTIMSGIVNAYSLLFGKQKTDELIKGFLDGKPAFKVSSTMPYIEDKFFVFKPMGLDLHEYVKSDDIKKIKKVRFVDEEDLTNLFKGNFEPAGEFLVKSDEKEKLSSTFLTTKERARVTIDRATSSSNIYYFSHCQFKENAGLWFYLEILDSALENEIKAAIRLLGDEGIGGDRTAGLGLFKPEFLDASSKDTKESEYYMTLSLTNPKDSSEIEKFKFYDITTRSGYIYSKGDFGTKKKAVRMFSEGSIVKGEIFGRVVDVTPNGYDSHPILRYGLAFLIPLPKGVSFIGEQNI
ncbi:CRISPR-associated RAMP protein, Csm4 family [Caldicellulosiruptor obsidiansis OB47]|uniref:CRISPR system Cms protein Csm4 n=1 Tax=Caldicellulosiruptor obsidiansis (strain ATCC BAA-2073 / JCM 16842 / OB47) TaxID=608506 RepID=D9THM9_CALOO|nr:type III-A CRISPR-associated RAMP protein Csm4 [Caldicellulosiruptor obsidiansis]ADL43504.1 CRISPR-associated RAMP protein, Csm4 family [Caldicellulosiruptor obsidiansis OB47]